MKNPERLGHFAEIALVLVCLDHVAAASYTRITASCEQSLLLFSRTMEDDIGFHDGVAGIVRCGQCVRVGRNVSPEILHLGPLAVDLSLGTYPDERNLFLSLKIIDCSRRNADRSRELKSLQKRALVICG